MAIECECDDEVEHLCGIEDDLWDMACRCESTQVGLVLTFTELPQDKCNAPPYKLLLWRTCSHVTYHRSCCYMAGEGVYKKV